MNTEEKRFHAAVAAMQSVISTCDQDEAIPGNIAYWSVAMADALLAELNATAAVKECLTPEPAADGWIPHKPGDPVPCNLDLRVDVKLASEIIRYNQTAGYWRGVSDLESNWNDCGEFSIIAWRPAQE